MPRSQSTRSTRNLRRNIPIPTSLDGNTNHSSQHNDSALLVSRNNVADGAVDDVDGGDDDDDDNDASLEEIEEDRLAGDGVARSATGRRRSASGDFGVATVIDDESCECVCSKCARPMGNFVGLGGRGEGGGGEGASGEVGDNEGERLRCPICFECYSSDVSALSCMASKCGHCICAGCLAGVQIAKQTRADDSDNDDDDEDPRYFKCPTCRASRQASDYFRLNLDSYLIAPNNTYINLRHLVRTQKDLLVRCSELLKEVLKGEKALLKGLPKVLSASVIGKATLAKNRPKICEQFASTERKSKLEEILAFLEKVSVSLALGAASVHKSELQGKMQSEIVTSILLKQKQEKARLDREEALRAELEQRANQAAVLRRRAERRIQNLASSLYGLGRNGVRQRQRHGPTSSPQLQLPQRPTASQLNEILTDSGDYEVVWVESGGPEAISDVVRATILAHMGGSNQVGQNEDAEGGGEGEEGGGGGGGGGEEGGGGGAGGEGGEG